MVKRKGNVNGTVELLKLLKGSQTVEKRKGNVNGTVELLKLLKVFSDGGKKEREC